MEPRLFTGPAFIVIGAFLLTIALRLWVVHPVNRVFRLGPYVTERGMVALLNGRTTFLCFGLLGIVSGLTRTIYWFVTPEVNAPGVRYLGSLETGLALWAAYLSVRTAVRLWLGR